MIRHRLRGTLCHCFLTNLSIQSAHLERNQDYQFILAQHRKMAASFDKRK